MKSAMVSGPHHLMAALRGLLPSMGFTPKKKEHIFDGSLYPMSCVEEVLAISLLIKLSIFVEIKNTAGYTSGLLRDLTLRNTFTRSAVSNSLSSTKEYSGAQRLTNSDSNCHLNSLALPKVFFIGIFLKKEGFLKDLLYNLTTMSLAYPGKEEL